jgi:hypothetical protein
MLPSEPKIFHGRESELLDTVKLQQGAPILGAGGMGKTSLARADIHHSTITTMYEQHQPPATCDSAATKVEALIGARLGLMPDKDLTHPVVMIWHFLAFLEPFRLRLKHIPGLLEPPGFRSNNQ